MQPGFLVLRPRRCAAAPVGATRTVPADQNPGRRHHQAPSEGMQAVLLKSSEAVGRDRPTWAFLSIPEGGDS